MNLFARIMSHGFALAVVVLIAVGLVYRGELFPGWELPEFMQLERAPAGMQAPSEGVVSREPAADTAEMTTSSEVSEIITAGAGGERQAANGRSGDPSPTVDVAEQPAVDDVPATMPDGPAADASVANVTKSTSDGIAGSEPAGDSGPAVTAAPATDAVDVSASPVHGLAEAMDTGREMAGATGDQAVATTVDDVPSHPETTDDADAAPARQDSIPAAGNGLPVALPTPSNETVTSVSRDEVAVDAAADRPVTQDQAPDDVSTMPDQIAPAGSTSGQMTAGQDAPDPAAPAAAAAVQPNSPAGSGRVEQSAYRLLAAAREAYWLRNYDAAEKHYRSLINLEPANPDGYGELGNMYFSQGRWAEASSMYFEAGKRLADEGIHEQAMQIVDVIRGLQGEQDDELEQYIRDRQAD